MTRRTEWQTGREINLNIILVSYKLFTSHVVDNKRKKSLLLAKFFHHLGLKWLEQIFTSPPSAAVRL